MDKDNLRKADFKTGVFLITFCLWFLPVTFLFMPFKETYGGVENVWYVSPWIFPAVILTLLLLLSGTLTVNAILRQGMRDVIEFPDGKLRGFRLTGVGTLMTMALTVASAAGLWYLIVNIEKKIRFSLDEAKWLADPSQAEVFEWSDPLAVVPLVGVSLVLIASVVLLAVSMMRRRGVATGTSIAGSAKKPSEGVVRFAVITLLFCELVYLLVPYVDFFIGILLFLIVFTVCFHVESHVIARISMGVYLAIGAVMAVLFLTGLDNLVNAGFEYTTDLIVLAVTLGYMVWVWSALATEPEDRRRYRTCLMVSWATPLILVPGFRFGLLVPLPHEGAVIELMHQIRYLVH